jgi:two-component system, sensor histidine kinase and response regulator
MKTILIIDDEEPLRLMLTELLKAAGYRPLGAASAAQGLRLARAHQPDLVLTDIRMPGMDGHAAVQELRRIPGFELVPIVIMTAHAGLPDMRRGMTLGADDYVAKPFENAELLRIVAHHLGRADQRRREADRELETLRRSLGTLLPQHFIGPLHDIIGCASVMALDASVMPPAEIREFSASIQTAAQRLHRQIENLLLYTSLEAGAIKPVDGPPAPLEPLVKQAAEAVARRHHRLNTLRLSLHPAKTRLSRDHVIRALTEVVDNACAHTPLHSPVCVEMDALAEGVRFRVSDQGPGLPPSCLQARPYLETGGRSQGAGLGLYLSRRLTQLLGGSWEVDSSPGAGTTLTLTFFE